MRPYSVNCQTVVDEADTLTRWGFDFVTGYRHKERPAEKLTVAELRKGGYIFDDKQWLLRIIFLESIAGVPGMVAGMLRHLRSLRLMVSDQDPALAMPC